MRKQVKETILLTGAGLTKNFGGLLASEIWAEILNNPLIHQYENVIKLLRTTFDYEEVYHHIITPYLNNSMTIFSSKNMARIFGMAYADIFNILWNNYFLKAKTKLLSGNILRKYTLGDFISFRGTFCIYRNPH